MTVSNSFQTLLSRIQPLQSEVDAAEGHIASIKSRLSESFSVNKFLVTGSFSRGSFIRGKSDIDLFVVFTRDEVRWGDSYKSSTTMLDNLRTDLRERFWNTPVTKDAQAIVLDFTDCRVDVVPAYFAGTTANNWPLYAMPDGAGSWMNTSPDFHKAYITQADKQSRGQLKYTAQLMKFWRECRNPRIPISSFHLEMVLASEGICIGVKSYAECIRDVLQSIAARQCRAMQDPLGISGYISCTKTESQRLGALDSVRYSRDHAKEACTWEPLVLNEAKRQWDIVFNDKFPW